MKGHGMARSTDLRTAYAQLARINFRKRLIDERPFSRADQAQRQLAFARCWEDACHDARVMLGQLEVCDIGDSEISAPGEWR